MNEAPRLRFAILGAGFIGLNLVRHLTDLDIDVSILDHNDPPPDLKARVRWIRADFADTAAAEEVIKGADTVFHFVSSTVPGDEHVAVSRELSDNIFATLEFLELCERMGVPRVVFASSSSVYGLQDSMPISEAAVTDPISSHGIQKLAIEKYLLLHRFHHGLDVRIARLSNPFGPGQRLYGRQGFIALTIGHLLKNEPILLRDSGKPIRDFVYISDVVNALHRFSVQASAPAVLNIGSGVGHSLMDVVTLIEELLGDRVKAVTSELRRADIPVSVLDISAASRAIGYVPVTSLRDGLVMTLRHHGIKIAHAANR